jgi:hypothetical protein
MVCIWAKERLARKRRMITYGKKTAINLKPAKDNASAWDSFKAKTKLASIQSALANSAEQDNLVCEIDEKSSTPRASKTNASKSLKRPIVDSIDVGADQKEKYSKARKAREKPIQQKSRKNHVKERKISEEETISLTIDGDRDRDEENNEICSK